MPSASDFFYDRLTGFADFSEFRDTRWYRPLPDDWCVTVTDVKGSTRAIEYNEEGRAAILRGVNQLANAVKVTLGPKGRSAKTFGSPTITKDGVITVEEAKGTETNLEVVEGMQFDRIPQALQV